MTLKRFDKSLSVYTIENKDFVLVDDVINWIDKLRTSNVMFKYAVDDCFGMLEDALTQN